jgi:hypothetical protein
VLWINGREELALGLAHLILKHWHPNPLIPFPCWLERHVG